MSVIEVFSLGWMRVVHTFEKTEIEFPLKLRSELL